MSEKSNTISVHVSFLCKMCALLFKSVSTYCTHKVEHHNSLQFQHNKIIVFEESESTLNPPNDNQPGPGVDTAAAADVWQTVQLNDLVPMEMKQEPPAAPVIFNSDDDTVKSTANSSIANHVNLVASNNDDSSVIKTEWVEDTSVKYETSSQNEDPLRYLHSDTNLEENEEVYNVTETQLSFIRSDADADMNQNPSHRQVDEGDEGPDPLEHFDLTQSSQSTSTLTTEIEPEYFNENRSDSGDDIICLDDSPQSTPNKIASTTGPTPTATTKSASNSFILSQLKLQCTICLKQFTSSAQLGIHVTICELYNGKLNESAAAAESSSQPQALRSRISSRGRRQVESDSSQRKYTVNCKECSMKVRRCNLKAHLRTEHGIFVEDSDRKYICHICGSAFKTSSRVLRHARVHSDARPFVCTFPGCTRAFKNELSLKVHLQSYHPQPP